MFTLSLGSMCLALNPERGGAIAAWYEIGPDGSRVDWLAPETDGHVACFPLVPFASRIRDGCFEYEGRIIHLPANLPPEPHALHGHGWQRPWTVREHKGARAGIEYHHHGDAWPWPYRAWQGFALATSSGDPVLEIEIGVTNLAERVMPYGLGLHPYFPLTNQTSVRAEARDMWEMDDEVMPERCVPNPLPLDAGMTVRGSALDNIFAGWRGETTIDWPERGARLTLTADPMLDFLCLYAPDGGDFFCVEPISNAADAFNLHSAGVAGHGARSLRPGAAASAKVRLRLTRGVSRPTI